MSEPMPFMSAVTSLAYFGAAWDARLRHTLFWIDFETRIGRLALERKQARRIGERTQS